jgi:hypothetical protein
VVTNQADGFGTAIALHQNGSVYGWGAFACVCVCRTLANGAHLLSVCGLFFSLPVSGGPLPRRSSSHWLQATTAMAKQAWGLTRAPYRTPL